MMERTKPPRSAFINFPLGRQCGKPNDADMQARILEETLGILVTASIPGEIVDMPYEWDEPFDWSSYMNDIQEMLKDEGGTPQDWNPNSVHP